MTSVNTLEFLLERIAAVDPTIDQSSTLFIQEFVNPVRAYFGIGMPTSDPLAIIRARVSEEFPDIEDSVLSDSVARIAALIFQSVYLELQAAQSRRSLTDRRLLSGSDMEDHRSNFFVSPENGRFATGVIRAYFPTPRNLTLDGATRITVPSAGDSPERVYRPTQYLNVTAATMRTQLDGTRYYVDIDVTASEPGTLFDLDPGEARGASGVIGASSVTNPSRIEGGVDADDTDTYLARIQTSNRNRSGASLGGLEYLLKTLGIGYYYLAQTGDPLILRDRIYGPSFIGGVLGGFGRDYSTASNDLQQGEFASLGVAYDVWIASTSQSVQQVSTVRVSNLRDEGMLLLAGDIGFFDYAGGVPVQDDPVQSNAMSADEYVLTSRTKSFGLVINDPSTFVQPFSRYTFSMYPIESGDVFEREGWVDPSTGIRSRGVFISTGSGLLTGGRKTVCTCGYLR